MPNVVFVVGLGPGDPRFLPKQAGGGVTFALALRPYTPDWRWQYDRPDGI